MVLNLDNEKLTREAGDESSQILPTERGGGARTLTRLNFFRAGMLGGFTLLGWRLWNMQKPLDETAAVARTNKTTAPNTRFITTKAPRGIIYDRSGKRLVSNNAAYVVTITANYLPDPAKGHSPEEDAALLRQRQDVYDNLARFLGMGYFLAIVPEQVNGIRNKLGEFTNPDRNAILNELEVISNISAQDWNKRLIKLAADGRDKSLLIVNEKDPIPVERFDKYVYLRTKFDRPKYDSGVLFLSEAELKMLQARFYIPAYQPVEIWSNLTREDAMRLTEKRLDFPGVDVQTNYVRQYENPRLWSHILGYTGRFQEQEQLNRANKEAFGENFNQTDPEDPSSKIPVYDIDDKFGRSGVEGWMEPFLRGKKGAKEVIVNSTGQILDTVRTGKPAQPGNNVYLTIDAPLQEAVANALEKYIDEANKKAIKQVVKEGAAVVMDVNTGEVLALVSFPSFNNNLYNKAGKEWTEAEIKEMTDQEKAVEVSRAISGRFAPGSTFKLITAAAALNEKKISRYTTFNCTRYINIPTTNNPTPSQPFRCWGIHNQLDVVGAIENSCDIFFYNASVPDETNAYYGRNRYYNRNSNLPNYFAGTGITPLNGYMSLFNLGKPTGIEIPGEYSGSLPGPHTKLWSIGETMTTSIGQGDLEITPLQMCMVTAAFANGGKLLQPRIVRNVKDAEGKEVLPFEPKLIRDVTKDSVKWTTVDAEDKNKRSAGEYVLAPGVLQVIREGMLAVTGERGTANNVMYGKMGRLKVAGKTGTAEYGEVIGKDKDGNDARATRAWFTAFAPYDKPEIAITVLIASGDIGNEGSTFAVPAVKDILDYKFQDFLKQKA